MSSNIAPADTALRGRERAVQSGMNPQAPGSARGVLVAGLLLTYSLLAIVGAITQRQTLSLIALLALLSAVLLPGLLRRQPAAWLAWLALLSLAVLAARQGYADSVLEAVPIMINAALACWFGCTLGRDRPRVAQFIVVLEGEARLAQRGVARYAREVTWFWTLLLAAQALVLAVLLLCDAQTGLLLRAGVASPLALSHRWAAIALHVGGYAVIGAAFVLEYAWRRWRLRHLPHQSLRITLMQLARAWPQLVRARGA